MKTKLPDLPTHIFIDTSNIRYACLRSCGIHLNFPKLINYFKKKYPNLLSIKYFEGIGDNDQAKNQQFKNYKKLGYEIHTLSRKAYISPAVYKNYICTKCKAPNRIKTLEKTIKLKSNVDVYIASQLLETALLATAPTHIILLSCDGDYAEMIKTATKNQNIHITVLATPMTPKNNCLSTRLKSLTKELPVTQYKLRDIREIKDEVS